MMMSNFKKAQVRPLAAIWGPRSMKQLWAVLCSCSRSNAPGIFFPVDMLEIANEAVTGKQAVVKVMNVALLHRAEGRVVVV